MLLALKLALCPMLILLASLAGRRWGVLVAGWIAGFPLTSGPISVFLALEQSPGFAARAAEGTLAGIVAMILFCLVYARLAPRTGAPLSLLGGMAAMTAIAWPLAAHAPPLPVTLLLLVVAIGGALTLIPRAPDLPRGRPPPWWDLPARMGIALGLVVGLTEAADLLGPTLTGLLSPFPVFASVLAVFTHRQAGGRAAAELLRGVILGAVAFSTFFFVVAVALPALDLWPAYLLAAAAAVAVNISTLRCSRA